MRERAYAICNDQKLPLDTRQLAFVLAGGFTSLHNHITSLESQFAAIGAGGVEPLRKCLHQIAEPAQAAPFALAGPSQETCQTCQGNGEVVTDWERYKHPLPGDVGDEAVAECQDCDGQGTVDAAPTTQAALLEALKEAQAGLEFAAARLPHTTGFVPSHIAALNIVNAALAAAPTTKPSPVAQGDAEDAARYRWLRARWGRIADEYDGDSDQLVAIRESDSHFEGWDVDPASLDRAIDAARAQAKEGQSHD